MRFRQNEELKREKMTDTLVEDAIEFLDKLENKEKAKNIDGCTRLKRNLAAH